MVGLRRRTPAARRSRFVVGIAALLAFGPLLSRSHVRAKPTRACDASVSPDHPYEEIHAMPGGLSISLSGSQGNARSIERA